MQWLQSILLSDAELCTARDPTGEKNRINARLPGANARSVPKRQWRNLALDDLPDDFFLKVADHAINDPQIASRIDDDRTSQIIWGDAKSARFLFLQMCIRDRHERCREIWEQQLSESERREYTFVYDYGAPSQDFFVNIMVNHEQIHKDVARESNDHSNDSWLSLDWMQ